MTQIETTQNTFGKATQKMIKNLIPSAKTFRQIGKDFIIKDENGSTVATWHKRTMKTGLIVIR
jgi:hypothetical protein